LAQEQTQPPSLLLLRINSCKAKAMPINELDPRAAQVSLAELSDLFNAPVAVVSSPEHQLNGQNAMKITEQLTEKLKPEKENKIISIVDFMGSTSGGWTSSKIRSLDEKTGQKVLHSGDFDVDLTKCPEFEQYLQEHRTEFEEKAHGDPNRTRSLAKKGFAIRNSQWNSYWRGKVAGGLTMALSMMQPGDATKENLNKCGIGALIDMDVSKMHVAIAVCIDGGPVTQEEQRTITTMVDEVVFDLRRRGADWAKNTAIFIVRFPDAEAFVRSLNGERNLMRATKSFTKSRQRDECKWKNVIYTMGLTWEVPVPAKSVPAERGASMFVSGMTIQKALEVQTVAAPSTLLQIAKTGDTIGVKRMIDAKCPIEQATTRVGFSALHACAYGSFADTAEVILKHHCTQKYLDSLKTPEQITPLFFAAQFGATDTAKLLLQNGATVNIGRDDGQSPLYKAAHKGHKAIVEMFANAGADFQKPANDGSSPLFIAAQHGQYAVVDYLIKKQADMNAKMPSGMSPIAIAAQMGKGDVVKLLAGAKAELNHFGKAGETALFKAAQQNMPDAVKVLVQCKADTTIANTKGKTALNIAQDNNFTDVVKLLG